MYRRQHTPTGRRDGSAERLHPHHSSLHGRSGLKEPACPRTPAPKQVVTGCNFL